MRKNSIQKRGLRKKLIVYAFFNVLLVILLFVDGSLMKMKGDWEYVSLAGLLLLFVICIYLLINFIKKIPRSSARLSYIIMGTGLLIGLILLSYANLYQQIYRIYGTKAFTGKSLASNDFLYFSITTFTTTGYGDITSVGFISNAVSASEMLFGCIINTILMAVLTSILLKRLK
jgi:voltage-gated potassium channel